MPSTYTGYRCKCGYGIHTTFDGSKINPCKECGNTSMRGEEISMDNYEKLPLPRITVREYHLLSCIMNAEGFNVRKGQPDTASDIIKNILHAYHEKEREE